nr:TonB-dependent siderophore receptor [Halomonas socia]
MVRNHSRHHPQAHAQGPTRNASLPGTAPVLKARALTLAIGCALAGLGSVAMLIPDLALAADTQVNAGVQEYHIAAGRLGDVLAEFAATAGVPLSFDPQTLAGHDSDGLQGRYTVNEGFSHLLAGSGYAAVDTGTGRYVLRQSIAADGTRMLETITVQGESAWGPVNGIVATRSATGTKTDTPLLETPASISVISRKQFEEQGARTVSDAVRTTPGIVTHLYGDENRYDFVYSRGFAPTTFLNGLALPAGHTTATHGVPQIEPYGLERIEVLRGSASALYGQSPAGGILSLVSKRPTETPFGEVQLQTGSHNRKEVAFDTGGPLTQDGTLLYRLTGLGRMADMQIDFAEEKRVFIAPSFTWHPTEDTLFTFLSSYKKVDSNYAGFYPEAGTLFSHPNGQIPRNRYLGEPGFGGFDSEAATVGYLFEHWFDDTVSFKQNLQYAFTDTLTQGLAARGWEDDSQQRLVRNANSFMNNGRTFSVDNQLTFNLDGDVLNHTILTGIDYQNFSNEFWYRVGTNNPAPLDPYNPTYTGYTPVEWADRSHTDQTLKQLGVYVQDQVRYEQWLLTLSGRYDSATIDTFNYVNGATTDRRDNAFSGRIGLNYLFDNGWSPYVSYSTSFQPVAGTDFSGNTFEPSQARQLETGIKYQPERAPIFAALSVFDITRSDIATRDPDNIGFQVQTGEANIRGIEFEAKATLFNNLDLTAAYAYSDSEVTESNDVTTYQGVDYPWLGNRLPFVPRHQASLWANYTFDHGILDGFSLGTGARYVDSLYGDSANVFKSPATTFVDLAASYDFGKRNPELDGLALRVNVKNLFDEHYVTCTGINACYIGEGSSALATLTYRW